MSIVQLFDISIQNVTMHQAIEMILDCVTRRKPAQILFVNAHCVNISRADPEYLRILQQADFVFADGIGMQIASRILRKPLIDNVNGTDMYPMLCQAVQQKNLRVFLLGGELGIAEQMRDRTSLFCPGMQICGLHHGFFTDEEESLILEIIRTAKPDLLLVAFGVPKQEKWIARNAERCGAKAVLGVGGLFDFYSGKKRRAPLWIRRIGLEWLHRLYLEPRRLWRRYIVGNVVFLIYTIQECVRKKGKLS